MDNTIEGNVLVIVIQKTIVGVSLGNIRGY
ncbi:predicted protein [Sclerotinia sclerotiorum 1980 UF-70]|uniref:Uncharacterized protein n=1 Tax=Sclerotinia sclerotiorum (strain ATCC 18683 / 1980 / Ss-1) TaxID=665079 RepID=A7F1K0_SCLS1|nr:predicted protein [Sclerotinia sclerotiorum 1980 UF-70]EDN95592.1 predicted protein [Sclerotinia sclerotiorum 1980 UF-70]